MTTTTTEATDSLGNAQEPRSWGDITVSLDGQIAQLGAHSRGDLANLRRMNPDSPARSSLQTPPSGPKATGHSFLAASNRKGITVLREM